MFAKPSCDNVLQPSLIYWKEYIFPLIIYKIIMYL